MLLVEEEGVQRNLNLPTLIKWRHINSFCALGSNVILYHDFGELKYLPGTMIPFNMKQYKLDRGMPYSKIIFFLCWLSDYLQVRGLQQWTRTLSSSRTRRTKVYLICLMLHQLSILCTINLNHPCRGYRGVWTTLRTSYGITVPQDDLIVMFRTIDPYGCELGKSQSFDTSGILHELNSKFRALTPEHTHRLWHRKRSTNK